MNKKADYSLWWGEIKTAELAEKILKNVFLGMLTINGISAIFMSLIGQFQGWLDFTVITLISLWVWKGKSVLGSWILLILNTGGLILTFSNKLGISQMGGANWMLSIVAVWITFRGLQAAQWFRKNKAKK